MTCVANIQVLSSKTCMDSCLHRKTGHPSLQILDGLTDKIVERFLPLLHCLVDNLALLDMLLSFAQVRYAHLKTCSMSFSTQTVLEWSCSGLQAAATSTRDFTRPVLTETGAPQLEEKTKLAYCGKNN